MIGFHQLRKRAVAVALVVLAALPLHAAPPKEQKPERMNEAMRQEVVRGLSAEFVYARKIFPMGPKGLRLKDGVLSPSEQEIRQSVMQYGPAVRPGDRAKITNVIIRDKSILFEINGGPKKKKKWYERIEVSGVGGSRTASNPTTDESLNPRGSVLELQFDNYVPQIGPEEIKKLLEPVFNFRALSAAEAYMDTIPPKVREAIKNHEVLVGMNREMVNYSKGRPPRRHRERDNGLDYEEWIYGEPPQEVQFIRFAGDEVVRIETMRVNGDKVVRTEKEVELPKMEKPTLAEADKPAAKPSNAPTLRRPGEAPPDAEGPLSSGRSPTPLPKDSAPPGGVPDPQPPMGPR